MIISIHTTKLPYQAPENESKVSLAFHLQKHDIVFNNLCQQYFLKSWKNSLNGRNLNNNEHFLSKF